MGWIAYGTCVFSGKFFSNAIYVFMRGLMSALCMLAVLGVRGQGELLRQPISREYEEENLGFILDDLENKLKIQFKYNAPLLPDDKQTFSFDEIALQDVLKIILSDTDLSYIYDGTKIIIIPKILLEPETEGDARTWQRDSFYFPQNEKRSGDSGEENWIILGTILDSVSFEPVQSALIYIEEFAEFRTTDLLGQFTISLAPGNYKLKITSLSHEPKIKQLSIHRDTSLTVLVKQRAYLINEVVIESRAQAFNVEESITGLELLSQREIKKLSSFLGENDVVKSILTIAGVNQIGEGSTGYNVRGGALDQNLVLQDGALIYNPSHVLGLVSSFNPELIREVNLYKGHIPAQYGGRISSVLEVITKDPNNQYHGGSLSLGMASSNAAFETPVIKDKTAIIAGGRLSYSSWFLKQIDNPDISESDARFYDFNLKIVHEFSKNSKITGSFYQNYDKFNFTDQFGYAWRNRIFDVNWRKLFSPNISSTLQISKGDILNEHFEPTGNSAFHLSSGLEYTKMHASGLFILDEHNIRAGIEGILTNSKSEELSPLGLSILSEQSVRKDNSREWALYLNDEWTISPAISLNAGIRFNFYSQIGPGLQYIYNEEESLNPITIVDSLAFSSGQTIQSYASIEPRISMRFSINEESSLKFSYNRIAQFNHLISNTATPTPVDIWQGSSRYIEPVTANNFSAGYFLNPGAGGYELSVESYFKLLENTIDYRDFADLVLNPHIETELLQGKGMAYGLELTGQKTSGSLTGRLSYSYSKSRRKVVGDVPANSINNGNWFPSNFDQPHIAKLFLNWETDKRNTVSLNFIYSTGRPISVPISNYIVQDVIISHFSGRNEFRIPDYHRLDFSYKIRLSRRSNARYLSHLTVSIYNLYARKNSFSIFFRQSPDSLVNARKLSVIGAAIPSANLSVKF